MFFAENYYGFDDGIFAGCRLLDFISRSNQTVSAQFADVPKTFSTPEMRIPCPDSDKFQVVREVAAYFRQQFEAIEIDGIRLTFPDGWALVRASNTAPYLTLRVEAQSLERVEELKSMLFTKLREFPSVTLPEPSKR